MNKILLLNPSRTSQYGFFNPPLGLLYLAGALKREGIDCDIVDGNGEGESAVVKAIERRYDAVGIPVGTFFRWRAFDTAQMVRRLSPRSKIVMGNVHATVMPEQCKRFADVVIKGEGEGPFVDYVLGREIRERGLPVDELPLPAWEKVNWKYYKGSGVTRYNPFKFRGIRLITSKRVPISTSRGCSAHCIFCSSWWIQKYRMRNPASVADEIEMLYEQGLRHFAFVDDLFENWGVCREILRRGLKLAYNVCTRVDALTEEAVDLLVDSGCYRCGFGIETGSEAMLEQLHKRANVEQAEKAIAYCKRRGLFCGACLIIGTPGETEETVGQTLDFLKRVHPNNIAPSCGMWILPGTAVYWRALKEGNITSDFWEKRQAIKVYTHEHDLKWLHKQQQRMYEYDWKVRLRRLPGQIIDNIRNDWE